MQNRLYPTKNTTICTKIGMIVKGLGRCRIFLLCPQHCQRKIIGVKRPAFGGTVPHFHQMSRIYRKLHYYPVENNGAEEKMQV